MEIRKGLWFREMLECLCGGLVFEQDGCLSPLLVLWQRTVGDGVYSGRLSDVSVQQREAHSIKI